MKNIGKILKHSAISHSTSMRNPRHSMYTDCKKKAKKHKVTDEKNPQHTGVPKISNDFRKNK